MQLRQVCHVAPQSHVDHLFFPKPIRFNLIIRPKKLVTLMSVGVGTLDPEAMMFALNELSYSNRKTNKKKTELTKISLTV